MHLRAFHHLAIQVHALEEVAAFYRDVLGLVEQARHRSSTGELRSIWLRLPEGFLALERVADPPELVPFRHPRPGMHLLAFRIHRAERSAVIQALRDRNVPIEHQTRWTVYVRDPEGNRIGLSHHPEDPVP
jgi:catechol 2,3-dioxygenase-like lactoylglutathione lyase family enzyme